MESESSCPSLTVWTALGGTPNVEADPWAVIDTMAGYLGDGWRRAREDCEVVETASSREGSALSGTTHAPSSTRSETISIWAEGGFSWIGGSIESERYR